MLIAEVTLTNLDITELGLGGVSLIGVLFVLNYVNNKITGSEKLAPFAETYIPKIITGFAQATSYLEIILSIATKGLSKKQMMDLGTYLQTRGAEIIDSGAAE